MKIYYEGDANPVNLTSSNTLEVYICWFGGDRKKLIGSFPALKAMTMANELNSTIDPNSDPLCMRPLSQYFRAVVMDGSRKVVAVDNVHWKDDGIKS